jgi:hypothetical protein
MLSQNDDDKYLRLSTLVSCAASFPINIEAESANRPPATSALALLQDLFKLRGHGKIPAPRVHAAGESFSP